VKAIINFIKSTFIGGILFVAPLVFLGLLVHEAIRIAADALQPIANLIPADALGGILVAKALAFLAVVGLCFLAGLVIRTSLGRLVTHRLEQLALQRVPGFNMFKSVARGMAGLETGSELAVALARIEDAWMLAFIVERHPDGLFTVFVPSAPTPAAGAVYFLTADRLKPLNVPVSAAVSCIMQLGLGSRALLERAAKPP
jgi:uncharacterized membrane protein